VVNVQKLNLAWFDHRTDIPQWISSEIGQVAAEWSVLERELEELIRLLMDADIQVVRIVTNQMNVGTRMATAINLIQAHILQKKLKRRDRNRFAKLRKQIEPVQTKRDILAHGLWSKYQGNWHVLRLRQSRPTPELRPTLETLSRAVLPQREIITRGKLRSIAREIVGLAKKVEAFCEHLQRVLAPLQHTPPKYSRRKRDYRLWKARRP
jgi:hypothetical protein